MAHRRKPRARKQRVVVRSRRQEHLTKQVRTLFVRGAIVATIGGVALLMAAGGDSFFSRFLKTHEPAVEIHAPQTLTVLPLAADFPAHRFWLWFPGTNYRLAATWRKKYSAVHRVDFNRQFGSNRIIVSVEARVPLVRLPPSPSGDPWALDGEGIRFALEKGSWPLLPQARFTAGVSAPLLGHWLAALSRHTALWGRVVSVSDNGYGDILLGTQEGGQILWGPPDLAAINAKADLVSTALDDAHLHLGGAALADLRFFDDGRIIVRPKSLKG